MFIRTERMAWVAHALLITCNDNHLGRLTDRETENLLGEEDAVQPAVLDNAARRFLLCCPFEEEDQPGFVFLFSRVLTQRSKMLKKSPKDWLKIGKLFLIETPQLFHLNVLIFKLETIHCSGCALHQPSFKILNTTPIYIIFFLQKQALPLIIMNHHQNNHSTISYIPPKTQAQFKIQPEPQRLQTSGQAP